MVKLLAFSDLHRDQTAAQKVVDASVAADVVVGAGDFATRGEGARETLDILKNCHAPVILVHGNHDIPEEISRFCETCENVHYLHGRSMHLLGLSFFGLGGEIPSRNSFDWNASETEENASRLLENCPKEAVLIAHTPPFGVADFQKDGTHEGSAAIRDAAPKYQLKLILCGHIHDAWGMKGTVGPASVHNLGPVLNWFDV